MPPTTDNHGPAVYLDHAASTPALDEVLRSHSALCRRWFVNPHGTSRYAEDARRAVLGAERGLLRVLGIPAEEGRAIWTAGGTEADNLACYGALAAAGQGAAVLVDGGAHSAMLESCRKYAREHDGICIEIPLDRQGALEPRALPAAPPSRVRLVAVCHVNNETGAVCDLRGVRTWMDRHTRGALLAVDAVQTLGKLPIPWDEAGIDLLCLSARKIGGPAAVGAVVCRRNLRLAPILVGGSQQHGLRAGTLDVVGILEFVLAAETLAARESAASEHLRSLNRLLRTGLLDMTRYAPVLISPPQACPAICCVAFPGYEGAVVMRLLAERGILVSTGSACHAESDETSHVLHAMGFDERTARGALRISLSGTTTEEEIRRFLAELRSVLMGY